MSEALAEKIEESFTELTKKRAEEGRRIDPDWNHSSNAGWIEDCSRKLCLLRLCPQREETSSVELQRLFDEGKIQEPAMRAELKAAGYELLEKTKKPFTIPDLKLTGEDDDKLVYEGRQYPVDYKSCSDGSFREVKKCETAIDLMKSKFFWIRHYPAQMYCYERGYNLPYGLLVFKNKSSGEKKVIGVPKNIIYFNMLEEGLQEVNRRVEREDPPSATWKDVCSRCGFAKTECFTEEEIEDYSSLTDIGFEDAIQLAWQRHENEKAHKLFEAADKKLKQMFHKSTVIIGGEFLFKSTPYKTDAFDLPDEVKAQIEKLKEPYKTTVERFRATVKYLKAPLKI